MNSILFYEMAALVALFAFSAFFSSAETAMFSLNPLHIEEIKNRNKHVGCQLSSMLNEPTRLLSTILIGNTLVNVAAVSVGYAICRIIFVNSPNTAVTVSVPSMTMLLLLFGEVTPKRIAMTYPSRVAELYARPLTWLIWVMTPVRTILERVAGWFQPKLHAADKTLTEEEVLTAVEVGTENGVFNAEERTMVDGIIRLEDIQAADVMTPRVDLKGIDIDDPLDKQIAIIRSVQFRNVPVYRETPDNIVGFLDVPRFLLSDDKDIPASITSPLHVPETMQLNNILALLQRKDQLVARVVDEYGGTAGIITRGDILEEITDDVDGEYGVESEKIQHVGPETWLVEGSTSLEEINHDLDIDIEAEGADRISGWAIAHCGRMVRPGDEINEQNCRLRIQKVRKHRVTSVLLTRLPPPEPEEEVD